MPLSNFLQLSDFSVKEQEKNSQNLGDVLKNLEDLNQVAFEACMKAFRAQGNINSYQFLLLSHLKYIFSITTEVAKKISRRIADDIELITIAENLNPDIDVRRNWDDFCCEQTPTAWLSFRNETFANFIKGPFSYVHEYNFDKKMSEFDEEKSLPILKRLYTIKQEPFIVDRYKQFLEEIGVSLSITNNQNKIKNKCGRPKKSSKNDTKNEKSQILNKKSKPFVEGNNIGDSSNLKSVKHKIKEKETSYIGNLGKKEMHTMICQRVIPISETYKQKIINRSIVLRKRVALGEMSTPRDSHIESYRNSDSNTSKKMCSSSTEIKRRKVDSTLSDDTETGGKVSKGSSTNSVFSKTSCYKFIRKPVFSSERSSPKFVIRPIACSEKNTYSVPRVVFKANNITSPKKIDHACNVITTLKSIVDPYNNCSLKGTTIDDTSKHSQNESTCSKIYENLPDSLYQNVEEVKMQLNGKHSININYNNVTQRNLNDSQFITPTVIETDKHTTYNMPSKNDSSKVVE